MEKLTANDPQTHSADLVAENIKRLKAMFPELVTESVDGAAVNIDVLRTLVGDSTATDPEEKYGLNWHGKRRARQLALTPSTGTLRPCLEESVDWDTTQNLMIEGDNLEVLKLLQKSYAGRVKMIYIDPPYNTGKDFIYPDDFRDAITNYLRLTGQLDGNGSKTTSNTETSGRFHTDWLNMMYPRLKLARNLLSEDGALFISIDDNEIDSLKKLCVEIFGDENSVGIISVLVNPRGRHLDKFIAKTHDFIVVVVRNADCRDCIAGQVKEGDMLNEYDQEDELGKYRELGLRNRNQAFNPQTRPKLFFPLYVDPATGRVSLSQEAPFVEEVLPVTPDGIETCWTWGREKVQSENELLVAHKMDDGSWRVNRKDYLLGENGEVATTLAKSMWLDKEFNNDYGRKSIKELFGVPLMDFPKSPALMKKIIAIGSRDGDVILDFFAGSATLGHAAFELCAESNESRKCILVQLPEPTRRLKADGSWDETAAWRAGFPTIAEITKERLRRAGKKIRESNPMFTGDIGFRVFKLASSNIQEWEPDRQKLIETLEDSVEHLKTDRTEEDILFELLLKLGLDLTVPIEEKNIAGKTVQSVGAGTLIVCLAQAIAADTVEELAQGIVAWHTEQSPAGETTIVFRDSAFADDIAKTNLTAILQQHRLENVRSL